MRAVRRVAFCITLLCLPGLAQADDDATALAKNFYDICIAKPLSLPYMEHVAKKRKLRVSQNVNTTPQGNNARSKTWILPAKIGVSQLGYAKVAGPKGIAETCGVSSSDIKGDAIKAALISKAKLMELPRETLSKNKSQRVTVWKFGANGEILLTDSSPQGKGEFFLNRIELTPGN